MSRVSMQIIPFLCISHVRYFYHTLLSLVMTFTKIFYSLLLYGIIDSVFKNTPIGNRGVWQIRIHMELGVIASIYVSTMGGWGQIFFQFDVNVPIE